MSRARYRSVRQARVGMTPSRYRPVRRPDEAVSSIENIEMPNGASWPKPSVGNAYRPRDAVIRWVYIVCNDRLVDVECRKVFSEPLFLSQRHRTLHRLLPSETIPVRKSDAPRNPWQSSRFPNFTLHCRGLIRRDCGHSQE